MRAIFECLEFLGQGPQILTVDQGIERIEELNDLEDDEVEILLKLLRRPGGIVSSPNAANLGQTSHIAAPGISVSIQATIHLKLSV